MSQELGQRWNSAQREREYYRIVRIPTPPGEVVEAGAFEVLPDGRVAVGTRRGDVFLLDGIDDAKPEPVATRFATGLDEIFGLAQKDGELYVTQSCELTRLQDLDGDGRADRFDTISADWGYENYHEYAFGSKFDPEGNLHVALGLSMSYHSWALFRGWVLKITPGGETIPLASGFRSPAGIGPSDSGDLVVIESQGPWNSSCSLKAVRPGGFAGHPASYNWYPFAEELGPAPERPNANTRLIDEAARIPALDPYAVVFPYIRMGRSLSGFVVDESEGAFGPFAGQMFVGDFTLSLIVRATTERVNGVLQGACYPFREELSTGLLNLIFTPDGNLLCGGTNRGWPVRGSAPFALERLDWTGKVPFEMERITVTPKGFQIRFTLPVDEETGADPASYSLSTFTHIYRAGYGGPEVDQTEPQVRSVTLAPDGLSATLELDAMTRGHVHEFDCSALRSRSGEALLHPDAYYTLNEVPADPNGGGAQGESGSGGASGSSEHSVPQDPRWLTYPGKEGPGKGKHVVLVAAEQEYRSEQSMPMFARLLAERHGFDCTVLFALDPDGMVDPSRPVHSKEEAIEHDIPGLEHLAGADAVIWFSRLLTLPEKQLEQIYAYLDSGKPLIGLRTANHGFIAWDYSVDGTKARFGEDVLGGSFRAHHGRWHQDSTRGVIVEGQQQHPILRGVSDVWGPSDVYRTYPEGGSLPADCTALLMGQPLTGRNHDDPPNTDLIPLPVAWAKTWTGNGGKTSRVFHSTMGSARDFESAGMRRMVLNALLWGLGLEGEIDGEANVDIVGPYAPLHSGFNYAAQEIVPRAPAYYR